MDFVTDRTAADVMLGTSKGVYTAADLNRVERNNSELAALLQAQSIQVPAMLHRTDWGVPGRFGQTPWPTGPEMARILGNLTVLCELSNVPAQLPASMDKLDYTAANAIEQQQALLATVLGGARAISRFSGDAESGGETL